MIDVGCHGTHKATVTMLEGDMCDRFCTLNLTPYSGSPFNSIKLFFKEDDYSDLLLVAEILNRCAERAEAKKKGAV